MIKRLFEAYPSTDYEKPEEALAGMIAAVMPYNRDIINEITHPETGLQLRSKFPPRIAEIREACDAIVAREAKRKRFETWGQHQMPAIEDRTERPTYEQLKAKYGPTWGIDVDAPLPNEAALRARPRTVHDDTIDQIKERHRVRRKLWEDEQRAKKRGGQAAEFGA